MYFQPAPKRRQICRSRRPSEVQVRFEDFHNSTRISFSDNGIGIAPEHHEQIFEIFGRIHPDKMYEGTGIGLAIVRKAVERMGGSVGVHSEHNKGSTFWITLKKASSN